MPTPSRNSTDSKRKPPATSHWKEQITKRVIDILRIGTRGSKLALLQAETVRNALSARGIQSELSIIKTSGESFSDKPFREAGIGAFVREIDDAMLAGDIDIAVHSMKDVPTKQSHELGICAVLPRASPYDVLVYNSAPGKGSTIGTSSLRRKAQLARYYPSYSCKHIRGNVDTRLRKLADGEFDGIVLAEAGLERLNRLSNMQRLPFVPSPNQGILAIVARNDTAEFDTAAALNHKRTFMEGATERIVMEEVGGGCLVPLGVFAHISGTLLTVVAEVLSLDGNRAVRCTGQVALRDYGRDARSFARQLKDRGGEALIAEAITFGHSASER